MVSLSPSVLIKLLFATLALTVILAELYAMGIISPPWLNAAVINSVISGIVIFTYCRHKSLAVFHWQTPPQVGLVAYFPAFAVIVGAGFLGIFGRFFVGGADTAGIGSHQWAWVLWIPVVEEITFRLGITPLLAKWSGNRLWAVYFSALLFAMVHGSPTLANLVAMEIGLPLGPFLLALCCEGLYAWGKRLWPLVAFHVACNGTVVLFATLDSRWLDWLSIFYN